MGTELDYIRKPIRRLRKSLKDMPVDPPVKAVHELRTCARRLQAIVPAVMPGKKLTRRLLKSLKPVRKLAGGVRDMDVLVAKVLSLTHGRGDAPATQLVEHLVATRMELARDLHDAVAKDDKRARRNLKRFSKQIDRELASPGTQPNTRLVAEELIAELDLWPSLSRDNLHGFRIKVKELRSVPQLVQDVDPKLERTLGKVKDRIGDWHDWHQLAGIAQNLLDRHEDQTALMKIESIGAKKLEQALRASGTLRTLLFARRSEITA